MTHAWDDARRAAFDLGAGVGSVPAEMTLAAAAGLTLAAPVAALCNVPGFDTSAMDGWVLKGTGPWRLGLPIGVGTVPLTVPLQPGEARPIATGAPVPPEADAVLRSERGVTDGGGVLRLRSGARAPSGGADIRPAGEEAQRGERVLDAGSILSPAAMAVAGVCGNDTVTVHTPPPVDLLLLGGEVVTAGLPPAGRVRDAHGVQLPALLTLLGARVASSRRIGDDRPDTITALAASHGPLVISTGGTAHGPTDHVRAALTECGFALVVDGVHMRPGHPAVLARGPGGRILLALPGNPMAAMVVSLTLGAALLAGMLGQPFPPLGTAVAATPIAHQGEGVRIVAVQDGEDGCVPTPRQGAAMLRGLAAATALAVIPAGGVVRGDPVPVLRLPWC